MLEPAYIAWLGRSRKGAWIEILADQTYADECDVAPVRERGLKLSQPVFWHFDEIVAPVRERGLKYSRKQIISAISSRSRKGAWIEITGS